MEYENSAAEYSNFSVEYKNSAAEYGNFFVEYRNSAAEYGNYFVEYRNSAAEYGNFSVEYLYFPKMYRVFRAWKKGSQRHPCRSIPEAFLRGQSSAHRRAHLSENSSLR